MAELVLVKPLCKFPPDAVTNNNRLFGRKPQRFPVLRLREEAEGWQGLTPLELWGIYSFQNLLHLSLTVLPPSAGLVDPMSKPLLVSLL